MKRTEWKRLGVLLLPAAMFLLTLTGCESPESQPEESPENRPPNGAPTEETSSFSVEPIYTIVRGDASSKEVTEAAVKLRRTLLDQYGIDLSLQTDWIMRGENVEDHRFAHEILIGPTNRAESENAADGLHEGTPDLVDYTVTSDGEDYILAAAEGCAGDAVDAFLEVLEADLLMLHRPPEEIDLSRKHSFPLESLLLGGVPAENYKAVVYPAGYDQPSISDVKALADLIYEACGVRLPVQDDKTTVSDPVIRLSVGEDPEVRAGSAGSYAVIASGDGFQIDGSDRYAAACAMDEVKDRIRAGMQKGGTADVSDPIRRITEEQDGLIVSAWTLSAPDMTREEQFAELAECGFNQVMLANPSDAGMRYNYLKWLTKYELEALWNDGSIHQGVTTGLSAEYVTADATWGHMLKDEPSLSDFAALAETYRTYSEKTGKVPFINLFPDYANEQQLGCKTYQEHLDAFFDTVNPAFASVDIYPMNVGGLYDHYFANLDSFATACRTRSIPFGVYIQSVSFASSKRGPSENDLRWQAYCCLSFGASDIEYFTYRTPNSSTEDFKDALIGRDDKKTDAWYGAQKVNAELKHMGGAFLRYDNLGAYTVNSRGRAYMQFSELDSFDAVEEVTVSGNKPVLIGAFAEKNGGTGRAFTCVNASDPGTKNPVTVTVKLSAASNVILYQSGTTVALTPDGDGCISFDLADGEGVFVTLD